MKKNMFRLGMLLLMGIVVLFHTVGSQNTTPHFTQDTPHYLETPLYHTRLFLVEEKTTTTFQIHFLKHAHTNLTIPPSQDISRSRSTQKFYTSFHTGACIHPTSCPCITSGVFCGGRPTCGIYCALPRTQTDYYKNFT